MKILVVNAGSTSVKCKLYDMDSGAVLAQGNCQRVGLKDSEIKYAGADGGKKLYVRDLADHGEALSFFLGLLTGGETKILDSVAEIGAVGHRVSMGGPKYVRTVLVDDDVIETAEAMADITPLHNPPQAKGIRACREIFGEDFPMAVGFDTAFHQTMPEVSYIYPIPYEYFEKYNLRRFGFHGLSYQFVTERYAQVTGIDYTKGHNMVVCHLGGGASMSAIKDGKSIDNTFGIGTGQGLACGSRAGSFDHVGIGYIMGKTGMTYDEVEEVLHRKSGIFGISGVSSDEKEIEEAAQKGNRRAQLALEVMAHQVKKYMGAYAFEMGGLDTVLFTGGIGENSDLMRAMCCKGLESFGVKLDAKANVEKNRTEAKISTADSPVDIWIVPTDEELVIAQDTLRLVKGLE